MHSGKNVLSSLGNRDRLAVKISQIAKTGMVGIANNDVVEDFDFKKLAGSNKVASNLDVRFRRSGFPTRMIVTNDDG